MTIVNFLKERKSVRRFAKKDLTQDELDQVNKVIAEVNEANRGKGLDLTLYENGKIIFEGLQGKAGYSGVMIEAPKYLAMRIIDGDAENLINAGYCLEKINGDLVDIGLGTCWITVDHIDDSLKKSLFGQNGEEVYYLMAIGKAEKKKLFEPEPTSNRLNVDQIVFTDNFKGSPTIEELEGLGLLEMFSNARYAPSYKNAQPWRFLVDLPYVYLYMVKGDDNHYSFVDMGVIMYYVEALAERLGTPYNWEMVDGEEIDGLKPLARIKI